MKIPEGFSVEATGIPWVARVFHDATRVGQLVEMPHYPVAMSVVEDFIAVTCDSIKAGLRAEQMRRIANDLDGIDGYQD